MISPIQSGANQGVQYSTSPPHSRSKLGRDDFLKIFLTQLQYQDPLNPMKGTEFTAQLAQFSSLEQLFNVNDNLSKIKSVQDEDSQFQALGLIGKQIKAQGDSLSLAEGKDATGAFSLDKGADCTVLVEDDAGNVVRRIPLGQLAAGRHVFTWDGRDEAGNELTPGSYKFEILALDQTGEAVGADTFICGVVSRVSLEGGSPVLYVGDVPVTFDQVSEVQLAGEGNANN